MVSKTFNLNYNIDIPVSNRSLSRFFLKSSMISTEFDVENYDVDFLGGEAINLFAKRGQGSCKVYFEDIEYAIKNWCRSFSNVVFYLRKDGILIDDLSVDDVNWILDDAIVHSIKIEGVH